VWLFELGIGIVISFALGVSLAWLLFNRLQRQSKNASDEEVAPYEQEWKSGGDDQNSFSAGISALIHAIRYEGRANRREERREDSGKAFREKLTIGLIALTLFAVGWQVREMVRVYEPIKEQADAAQKSAEAASRAAAASNEQAGALKREAEAIGKQAAAAIDASKATNDSMVAAQRAWVGPQNASFAAEPKVGNDIDATIQYLNTGREPATGFSYALDPFAVAEQSPQFGARVTPFMTKCFQTKEITPGQVVYASTGFSSYSLNSKIAKELVDADVVSGKKSIVIQGCFIYFTEQAVRHSFFCYFYKQGFTKFQNLNICQSGHYAD
jgi:hypothetical protein